MDEESTVEELRKKFRPLDPCIALLVELCQARLSEEDEKKAKQEAREICFK